MIAQHICRQLVTSLIQLHNLKIVHRDLKPENILVDHNWEVIISDFGFAIDVDELKREGLFTRVGTLEFYPIEMLSICFPNPNNKLRYDERVDIWSMGIIIFELLYGRTPFFSSGEKKDEETKDKIRRIKYNIPQLRSGFRYPEAEDLFKRIFVLPQNRISLVEILDHPWLTKTIV